MQTRRTFLGALAAVLALPKALFPAKKGPSAKLPDKPDPLLDGTYFYGCPELCAKAIFDRDHICRRPVAGFGRLHVYDESGRILDKPCGSQLCECRAIASTKPTVYVTVDDPTQDCTALVQAAIDEAARIGGDVALSGTGRFAAITVPFGVVLRGNVPKSS